MSLHESGNTFKTRHGLRLRKKLTKKQGRSEERPCEGSQTPDSNHYRCSLSGLTGFAAIPPSGFPPPFHMRRGKDCLTQHPASVKKKERFAKKFLSYSDPVMPCAPAVAGGWLTVQELMARSILSKPSCNRTRGQAILILSNPSPS